MSQRNPMNERYQTDKHQGTTRKSAASAKPKSKAAASVTYSSPKKDPKAKKAELKAQRRAESEKQREIDRKYSTPDTERYKKLRRIFWATMVGAIVCVVASWLLRGVQPEWLAMAALILAYVLIIFAFYIDLSKVRKERRAYQARMMAKEAAELKEREKAERAARAAQPKKKGAANAKAAASKEQAASDEASEEASGGQAAEPASKKKFGFLSRKKEAEAS